MKIFYIPVDKQQEVLGEVVTNPVVTVFDEEKNVGINFELAGETVSPKEMVGYLNDAIEKLNAELCKEDAPANP